MASYLDNANSCTEFVKRKKMLVDLKNTVDNCRTESDVYVKKLAGLSLVSVLRLQKSIILFRTVSKIYWPSLKVVTKTANHHRRKKRRKLLTKTWKSEHQMLPFHRQLHHQSQIFRKSIPLRFRLLQLLKWRTL